MSLSILRRIAASLFFLACLQAPVFASDASEPININTADAQTLSETLNRIGIKRAEAIIAYRESHGPFQSLEELAEIKGIGDKILADNAERIKFSD